MFVNFDGCMHIGKRDKASTWWVYKADLSYLAVKCDGGHVHLPWGLVRSKSGSLSFATVEERRYPHLLCERVATLVTAMVSPSLIQIPELLSNKRALVQQRRGQNIVVPEYKRVFLANGLAKHGCPFLSLAEKKRVVHGPDAGHRLAVSIGDDSQLMSCGPPVQWLSKNTKQLTGPKGDYCLLMSCGPRVL